MTTSRGRKDAPAGAEFSLGSFAPTPAIHRNGGKSWKLPTSSRLPLMEFGSFWLGQSEYGRFTKRRNLAFCSSWKPHLHGFQ
jgi:hypothetical protein